MTRHFEVFDLLYCTVSELSAATERFRLLALDLSRIM